MDSYKTYLDKTKEFGFVTKMQHPIVTVEGLPTVAPHELVIFETGQMGEIFTISPESVEILLFSKDSILTGTKVTRTNTLLSIPVGEELLGTIIDPLGNPISGTVKKTASSREIEQDPLSIAARSRIKTSLRTGVSVVDMLIPIGKGQRELVIGDRKTGKSSFLLSAVKNQVQQGTIAIYVAIGKKKNEIKDLEEFFKKEGLLGKIIIVATSSFDSPGLIYLTPYAAMTIAEHFRDKGKDTLVILDDLSTHAKFYREISLLARNFPGRDSYPGDIFHTHAKLLERAGNFSSKSGDVSITCLPVVETIEGDLTGYIATNIMSMTDGHIFFDSNVSAQGRRPAVNISLSVTRVGRQIQTGPEKDINREVLSLINLYDKMQNLSHFGTELTDRIKSIFQKGEKVYAFFDQPYDMTLPTDVQLVLFCLVWQELLDKTSFEDARKNLLSAAQTESVKDFLSNVLNADSFAAVLERVSKNKDQLLALCQTNKSQQN
ncbi:MAG TPA: F0F1 ATP synthase subunit alpha [Patescibacteria group bacterium]|nr:F0F1 ATP synthase subunit alpha [Patescibacteria group bacterium]